MNRVSTFYIGSWAHPDHGNFLMFDFFPPPLCMVIFLLFKERKQHFPLTIYLYFVFSFTLLILPGFLVKYTPVPAVCL